ncbi:zinc transport system permease protein [Trichococcus patagoniensis]|uniref:Zinc transport system permease protein n=1 Tax=Trichococcus patagoniensis TaxID=382641 RepID=A0A2T5IQ07_9LACT|nr:metal ABC transporter permease [Trichococcus patagoniensis]PTQ85913.1 zinc transport system permease protein [Trichococcus patagoniensis]
MIQALSEYQFMQHAFIASLLASVVCGIIGVIIVEKKLLMMSGGIAHTAYGGVGLGYFLGFEPIIGAFLFSIAAALGIGTIKRKGGVQADILIGLFWSLGMAFGIVFIALMPGYPPDLNSYLFGNILSVTRADLYLMLVVTFLVLAVVIALFHAWKAYLFDEEFAAIIGVKTIFLEYLLLVLVAMTVVALIRVAGIILVLALLTAPAAMAGLFSKKLKNRMLLAVLFGAFFSISGLWLSYGLNIPSGACIVMTAVAAYFLAYAFSAVGRKMKRKSLASKQSVE